MSLSIDDNLVVSIQYTLSDDDANVIDSSEESEPMSYLHGAGNIIPGLEKALAGKSEGDKIQVSIEPDEAYGEIDPDLIQTVDISAFEGVESVEVGMQFQSQDEAGFEQHIIVKQVEGNEVTVDANHPLAGAVLHFDVEVVGVREAVEEEIAHRHAH